MLASCRFAVAVHALTVVATYARGKPVCSSFVASSANTNPVVIRRLMLDLEKAGLVYSSAGRGGGFSLAREAVEITLADIYRAVEGEGIFRLHKLDPRSPCPVGNQIFAALAAPLADAEGALEETLGRTSLAAVTAKIAA